MATTIVMSGQEYDLVARHLTAAGDLVTHVAILDLPRGRVVDEALTPGWLDQAAVLQHAREMASAVEREPDPLAGLCTTDHAWVRIRLAPVGTGVGVESEYALPTESGLAEVKYDHVRGRLRWLQVIAYCSEAQQEAIADLLLAYYEPGLGIPLGFDPVCIHDPLMQEPHGVACRLVGADQMAGALQVEVHALLAAGPGGV